MKPMLHGTFDSFYTYGDFVEEGRCIKNVDENNFIEFVLKITFARFYTKICYKILLWISAVY